MSQLQASTGTTNKEESTATTKPKLHCQFCEETFASRNALFRHLRRNADCFQKASEASGNALQASSIPLPKQKVGIRFGYHVVNNNAAEDEAVIPTNELAAQQVQQAFFQALKKHQPVREEVAQQNKENPLTQATAAKLRHPSLAQEEYCSAASDFMGLHYQGENVTDLQLVRTEMQQLLDQNANNNNNEHIGLSKLKVLDATPLPVSSKFQAEKSCTQRVYHYLLPLEWLEGGQEAREWWLQQQLQANNDTTPGQQHRQRIYQRRPDVLKRLKEALQAVESRTLSERRNDKGEIVQQKMEHGRNIASPGRFGSLWTKERRCWHNFADPQLGGKASPSNDPVWRTIDKAKVWAIVGDVTNDNDNNGDNNTPRIAAVLEFRGDSFVTQQVRRMVGAIVAMTNGWLPINDFCKMATRSDVVIETPLAPPGRLYFAGGRFHFMELKTQGTSNDEDKNDKNSYKAMLFDENAPLAQEWQRELQLDMIRQAASCCQKDEQVWLEELQTVVAPRIQAEMDRITAEDQERLEKAKVQQKQQQQTSKPNNGRRHNAVYTEAPSPYLETLSLLRTIVKEQKWPRTSKARSRVIRSVDPDAALENALLSTDTTASSFDGERYQSGSFTVVNEALFDGKLPLGNELFPELAKAVFALELELAKQSPTVAEGTLRADGERPSSSHCAINHIAEFVPHVDSGRGRGQSVSMIVGLGDFDGGAIFVEGQDYDLRYKPIEFDGWKQRHWTAPFEGERYSLVWFTPAGNEDESQMALEDDLSESPEDRKAKSLVLEQQKRLPSFPLFKYRPGSTDALAINEIFDTERGCAYELKNHIWDDSSAPEDFSPKGHRCVLDIGAHIGAFSRFALAAGCPKVIAYEPEPANAELLSQNLKPTDGNLNRESVEIHANAVAQGESGFKTLIHARNRNDGTMNTWRHALEDYSQYVDRSTKLPSATQEGTLTRSRVLSVPFFGKALVPDVTFVKMDCEGAEIDILLSDDAGKAASWLDVTHFVCEWSFTKEKRVQVFQKAIGNLKAAGFTVWYDGQGAWWDTITENTMWPFHSDLVVFARRKGRDP